MYCREEQSQEQSVVRLLDHSYERVELWEDALVMFDREKNSICSLNSGAAFEETGDLTTYEFEGYSRSEVIRRRISLYFQEKSVSI